MTGRTPEEVAAAVGWLRSTWKGGPDDPELLFAIAVETGASRGDVVAEGGDGGPPPRSDPPPEE